jgi:hypothetical protein
MVAYEACLEIIQWLADQQPNNAGCQRDLAVVHAKIGTAFQAQGKLEAAQAAFRRQFAILKHLVEQDPGNPHCPIV